MTDDIYYSTRKEVEFIRRLGMHASAGKSMQRSNPGAWKIHRRILLNNYIRCSTRDWGDLDKKICLKVATEELRKLDGEGN